MALAPQGKQPMSKGKGKAGSGGAGGGSSTKATTRAGSSGQGSSRSSAPPARIIGFRTEEPAVQAAPPLAAEAAGAAQQTEPEPAGGGSTKKEKEKLRKERQRQRKVDEAWEALQVAIETMEETAGSVLRCDLSFPVDPWDGLSSHAKDLVSRCHHRPLTPLPPPPPPPPSRPAAKQISKICSASRGGPHSHTPLLKTPDP